MMRFTSQETEFKNLSLVSAVKVAIVLFVIAEIIVFVSLRGGDDSPAGRASAESAGADRPRQSFDLTEVLGGRVSIGTVDLDERVSRPSATGGDAGAPGRIASSSSVSGASSDTGGAGGSSGTDTSSDSSGGSSNSSGSTGGSSGSDSSPPSDDGGSTGGSDGGSTTTSNDGSSDGSGSTGGGGAGDSGGSTDGEDDSDGGYSGSGGGGGGGCC